MKKISLFVVALALTFTSCKKESGNLSVLPEPNTTVEKPILENKDGNEMANRFEQQIVHTITILKENPADSPIAVKAKQEFEKDAKIYVGKMDKTLDVKASQDRTAFKELINQYKPELEKLGIDLSWYK